MPEGPECKIIANSLNNRIKNKELNDITILSGRYITHGAPDGYPEFKNSLPTKITEVKNKGKFIYILFENGWIMFNTLGMSGNWKLEKSSHSRIEFKFEKESVYYNDSRNFGTIKFTNNKNLLAVKLHELGKDILSETEEIKDEWFVNKMREYNGNEITSILMDQTKVISGVGNYIKCECLYINKINPKRKIKELTDQQLIELLRSIQKIAKDSYNKGGASVSTYSKLDGTAGTYSNELKIYTHNRSGKKCPEGHLVKKMSTLDKRTTHYCPECQI